MDSFALVQSARFSTTDRWSWRISALAFPMRISNSLFCQPSLVNETPRYLNLSDVSVVLYQFGESTALVVWTGTWFLFFRTDFHFGLRACI